MISDSDLKSIEETLEPLDKRKNELERRLEDAKERAGGDISETVISLQQELNEARALCSLFDKAKDKPKIENSEDSMDSIMICKMSLQLS